MALKIRIDEEVFKGFQITAGFDLREHLLYACYGGSTAHNTYVPPGHGRVSFDDIDVVFIVDPPHELPKPWNGRSIIRHGRWDAHIFSIGEFTQQLAAGVPEALFALWVREEDRLEAHSTFEPYFVNRDMFVATTVLRALRKYEPSQLEVREHYSGYMSQLRKAFVTKQGYDTHEAARLFMRAKMCVELVDTGTIEVYREDDRDILCALKRGYFTKDEAHTMIVRKTEEADKLFNTLPLSPDRVAVKQLMQDTVNGVDQ